jgi:membrane peptidoglycan carboxypeptidase
MGYPNKRVSMTDVHGEPQQGGYLPAEIWHDYMAGVTEGKPCVPFKPSSEQISYQPFYGKYATTGRSESLSSGEFTEPPPSVPKPRSGPRRAGRRGRDGGLSAPARPEAPPAPAPAPPPVPAPSPPAETSPPPGPGTGGAAP